MTRLITDWFEEVKDSESSEDINEFLIALGREIEDSHRNVIHHFIKKIKTPLGESFKLNLVYVIGELGKKVPLEEALITILIEIYYQSDRWIRNETIQAFGKIYQIEPPLPKVMEIVARALMDEYPSIKLSSAKILANMAEISPLALRNILRTIDTHDKDLMRYYKKIIFNHLHTEHDLFYILDSENLYAILKPRSIRNIIMTFFDNVLPLKSFGALIDHSTWEMEQKELFQKEINDFMRALVSL